MMNMNQFTQKTLAAMQRSQALAVEYGHVEVQPEHMMMALTEDANDLIPQLLTRCGVSVDALRAGLEDNLSRMPRVSGAGSGKVYLAGDTDKALLQAEKTAEQMKDEYLSVEHVWMGLCAKAPANVSRVLKSVGYHADAFLKALSEVRGATRVTSDSPEETYDALKNTAPTWWISPASRSWIRSSGGTVKSGT